MTDLNKVVEMVLRVSRLLVFVLSVVCVSHAASAFDRLDFMVRGPSAVSDALLDDLRGASTLQSLSQASDTPVRDVLAAARSDYTRLIEQLYAKGYYSGSVRIQLDGREAASLDPFRTPSRVQSIRVLVTPGPRFAFGQARVGPSPPGYAARAEFAEGAPAEAGVVRTAVGDVVEAWREAGYPKARVSRQDIVADHARSVLLVNIQIEPGRSAVIGSARVTGQTKVKPERVEAIAGLPEGSGFAPGPIAKAAERLRSTGTFQSVRIIEAETVNSDGSLDFELNVVDRKPRRIGGGIEYSSFDGITATGYWLHRNFLRGAERFRVEAQVSQLGSSASAADYDLSLRLEKPAVFGPDTQLFAEARLSYEDEPDYFSRKLELGAGLSRQFNDRLTGSLGVGLSYSEVQDRFAVPVTWRSLRLVTLPGTLTYDGRDDPLDTKRGVFLSGSYTPFYETVQGQTGHHLTFDARGYRAIGADERIVLAGRLNAGMMIGPDAVDAPPEFLFYSGGGGTVRGQPYNSLGANYAGLTLGGRSFAAVSGEVRFAATETIGVVALADAGFVGPDDFSAGDWHAGAGLGLRYKTPVGPIRLDVTGPVAGNTGAGVQIYIGIGQAF